jgi:hypothetical protein
VTDRQLPLVAVLPLAAYGVAVAVEESSGWSALVAVVALLTALPLVSAAWPAGRLPLALPGVVLALAVAIEGFLTGALPSGIVADVTVGILVGAPLWAAGLIAGVIDRPGLAFAAFTELLVDVVVLRATQVSLSGPVGTTDYSTAWIGVVDRQVSGVAGAIAAHGLGSPIQYPTASVTDPVLILLAILALAGVLLPLLPPVPSRRLPPAPAPRRDLAPPVRRVAPPVLNPPESTPTDPRPSPGPTLAPVIGAIVAVVGFETIGAADPRYSFLVVTAAAAAVLAALVLLGRRGVPRAVTRARRASTR